MLKIGDTVSSFFQFILEFPSKLILDFLNKGLRIFDIFSERNFKVGPCDQSGGLIATHMLSLSKLD